MATLLYVSMLKRTALLILEEYICGQVEETKEYHYINSIIFLIVSDLGMIHGVSRFNHNLLTNLTLE